MNNSMLLLHLSDIHFQAPVCQTEMDPDLPYRTALINDLKEKTCQVGDVKAIMVTGDIACRGLAVEYDAALLWLKTVAKTCNCPMENIFVVPGNHDVDRGVITKNGYIRDAHNEIIRLCPNPRTRKNAFLKQLYDPTVGKSLLESVQNYNEFAAYFGCQLYLPEQLFWTKNFQLNDSFILRMYGLTSTVFSGMNGEDDVRNGLYLSPYQAVFNPEEGVISLAMCHHPPEWLIDSDDIDDALKERVTIHLLGHKHRQRASKDDRYVRFSSGALIPDQYEPGWEPGYNLIKLSINSEKGGYYLDIKAYVLIWQTRPDMFRLKQFVDGSDTFYHRISLKAASSAIRLSTKKDKIDEYLEKGAESEHPEDDLAPSFGGTETEMSDLRTRNLVFRFWALSSSQRRVIAQELGIIDSADIRLPEAERYGRAFQKVKDRGLVDQLADKIAEKESEHE